MENITQNTTPHTVEANKNIRKKISAFFDKNYAMFFAPIIALVIYLVQLVLNEVYPFGTNTVSSYDLSAQIVPFIEHLFDVMSGKSTLEYSYAIMGGADVTGTFLYFFVSPFSFLFLIFGDGKVAYASWIVMAAKLMSVSAVGVWFAKKLFKSIPDYLCIAIGLTYTYCGYMFVANTYINWVDFLIYMPLCAGAFRYFVKTRKYLPFAILMACCVCTCFSIACFSMFIVFPTLIAYALLCVKKEEQKSFVAYVCLAFVIALILALPVLVPAVKAVLNSARGGGLFDEFWYGYTLVDGVPTEFDASVFIERVSTTTYKKWSYIFADSIFVILTIIWFYRKSWKEPFVRFMAVAGVLTLLPTVVDEAMMLLNMGSYMEYSLRFGFLNALYFLAGACLCLEEFCYDKKCAYDGTPLFEKEAQTNKKLKNKGGRYEFNAKIASLVLIVVGVIATAVLLFFVMDTNYKDEDFWGLIFANSSDWNSLKGFSASFAHTYGGLEIVLVFLIVLGLVAVLGSFLVGEKKVSPRLLSIVMVVLVGVQVIFYNNQLVVGNLSTQQLRINDYQTLAAQLNERDTSYFRIKDYGEVNQKDGEDKRESLWTANVPFSGGSNSFSAFSSVLDEDNFVALELFGYLGNNKNSFKSSHNTHGRYNRSDEFGDSFLGYKYFFVPHKQIDDVERKSYMKKVMVQDEEGNETQLKLQNGSDERYYYYVYENTIVFPSAYRVSAPTFRLVEENSGSSNRRLNQAALYEFLRGENLNKFTGSQYVTVESASELSEYLWTKAANVEVGAGKITATVENAVAGEFLFLNFVASKGYTVTVNGKSAMLVENDLNYLMVALEEGSNSVEFVYKSPYKKYFVVGLLGAIVGFCAVYMIAEKTKFMKVATPVISILGIVLATVVVGFFFLYPTTAWIMKWLQVIL